MKSRYQWFIFGISFYRKEGFNSSLFPAEDTKANPVTRLYTHRRKAVHSEHIL